jgi:translocation and assembly module TamB
MADEIETAEAARAVPRTRRGRTAAKWALGVIAGVLLLIVAALALLNSPIGHRWVVDQIAKVAPASGLKISIGRIDGNLYGKARLHDVTLSDPQGPFLSVPLVDLDWRPTSWFASGLDVRELVTHRGTLYRLPKLNPGDPDAPILPNFDIRVDRLAIEDLTIAKGVAGPEAHKVNLVGKADIRDGRVMAKVDARLGDKDALHALVDAEPDRDKFDLNVRYDAPKGGVLAGLIGTKAGFQGIVAGKGSWSKWDGYGYFTRDGANFAASGWATGAGATRSWARRVRTLRWRRDCRGGCWEGPSRTRRSGRSRTACSTGRCNS